MDCLNSLVTAQWLADNLTRDDIIIVDATLPPPGVTHLTEAKSYISGAVEFDLLGLKQLKQRAQTPELISAMLTDIGVQTEHHVIIYDRRGLFSAPRLWWILRTLGHQSVSILDGGLPAWIKAKLPVQDKPTQRKSAYPYTPQPSAFKGVKMQDVQSAVHAADQQIVDARSQGRFNGTEPEPRPGLRSGHIPSSYSLPIVSLSTADGVLRSRSELAGLIGAAGIELSKPIITTCGSGVTAAGLAFIFHLLGKNDVSVYSGSWAEWGASDAPIAVS